MTLTQKKWLKWAVIGFILGTIAVLAYRYFQPKKAAPTYITATAEQPLQHARVQYPAPAGTHR